MILQHLKFQLQKSLFYLISRIRSLSAAKGEIIPSQSVRAGQTGLVHRVRVLGTEVELLVEHDRVRRVWLCEPLPGDAFD